MTRRFGKFGSVSSDLEPQMTLIGGGTLSRCDSAVVFTGPLLRDHLSPASLQFTISSTCRLHATALHSRWKPDQGDGTGSDMQNTAGSIWGKVRTGAVAAGATASTMIKVSSTTPSLPKHNISSPAEVSILSGWLFYGKHRRLLPNRKFLPTRRSPEGCQDPRQLPWSVVTLFHNPP